MPKPGKETGTGLSDVKRRLSPMLMPLECVSGVGVSDGKLAIYLATETTEADLKKIRDVVERSAWD